MADTTHSTNEEQRIRAALEAHFRATRAKDAAGALAAYSPDVVKYDLQPPLAYVGEAAHDRSGLDAWFAQWESPVDYVAPKLDVRVSGDLGLAFGLVRMGAAPYQGERWSIWIRLTVGLSRVAGEWRIVHEHVSVPFYMDGSYRAATDLTPETRIADPLTAGPR